MEEKICKFYCYRKSREDIISEPLTMDKLELVVFDMDGVLTDIISSWKYIHDYFNTTNEKSVDDYVKGKIDDKEFIRRDADLWKVNGKPLKKEKLDKILLEVPIMDGAKKTIDFLKNNNVRTAIVSAGLDILANRVADYIGIDFVYANGIKVDKYGYLNGDGVVNVKLRYKEETVRRLAKKMCIPLNRVASVGNSCFDIPMFEITGLSIAFNPEDNCARDAASFIVEGKNLIKILPILERFLS
jgi:phosphoserine phosphatase